jgi:hypothetical protein
MLWSERDRHHGKCHLRCAIGHMHLLLRSYTGTHLPCQAVVEVLLQYIATGSRQCQQRGTSPTMEGELPHVSRCHQLVFCKTIVCSPLARPRCCQRAPKPQAREASGRSCELCLANLMRVDTIRSWHLYMLARARLKQTELQGIACFWLHSPLEMSKAHR